MCRGGAYLNGTAYTNPDFALEYWATGRIEKHINKLGAKDYARLSIPELEDHIRKNFALPGFGENHGMDLFAGSEMLLARVEELTTYIIELHNEIEKLKAN